MLDCLTIVIVEVLNLLKYTWLSRTKCPVPAHADGSVKTFSLWPLTKALFDKKIAQVNKNSADLNHLKQNSYHFLTCFGIYPFSYSYKNAPLQKPTYDPNHHYHVSKNQTFFQIFVQAQGPSRDLLIHSPFPYWEYIKLDPLP